MKQALLNLMRVTGAFAPFRMANRDKALILTYHRFSETGVDGSTPARAFARQLAYLTTHYRIVPLARLIEYLTSGRSLPTDIAAIAIDDGYRDAYEIAFPLLRRYNAPATVFAVTEFVDRMRWLWTDKMRFLATRAKANKLEVVINNQRLLLKLDSYSSRLHAATEVNEALKKLPDDVKEEIIPRIASSLQVELPLLPPDAYAPINWRQAREMDTAGVTIASHTATHPILTRVSEERLRTELQASRSRLEEVLQRDVDQFCYPNGDHNERVARAVRNAGYRCAVTIQPGLNGVKSDLLRLRRVHTQNDFAHFIRSTSGFDQTISRFARVGARTMSARRSGLQDGI